MLRRGAETQRRKMQNWIYLIDNAWLSRRSRPFWLAFFSLRLSVSAPLREICLSFGGRGMRKSGLRERFSASRMALFQRIKMSAGGQGGGRPRPGKPPTELIYTMY